MSGEFKPGGSEAQNLRAAHRLSKIVIFIGDERVARRRRPSQAVVLRLSSAAVFAPLNDCGEVAIRESNHH
jgi:hypothetical protein